MPTAEDYDMWCRSLQGRADEMTAVVGPLVAAATPDVIVGGRLAVTVDVAIRASQTNALAVAGMLRELADECTRRAHVCRTYEAALGTYASAYERWEGTHRAYLTEMATQHVSPDGGVTPPARPVRPVRPASWVEVGSG